MIHRDSFFAVLKPKFGFKGHYYFACVSWGKEETAVKVLKIFSFIFCLKKVFFVVTR